MDLPPDWDDETVQDVVDVLQDIVLWEMSPPRWDHVARILQQVDVAYAAVDGGALREAVTELEINGPIRISRIGSKDETGIPQPVFEHRNTLIHKLTSERRATSEDSRDNRQPR